MELTGDWLIPGCFRIEQFRGTCYSSESPGEKAKEEAGRMRIQPQKEFQ
jgi:hypothetical protein